MRLRKNSAVSSLFRDAGYTEDERFYCFSLSNTLEKIVSLEGHLTRLRKEPVYKLIFE